MQALGSVHQWKVAQAGPKNLNTISMSLILTAGFAIMVYLGDVLEEHGIGDGISFVICMGIVTGEPYCLDSQGPADCACFALSAGALRQMCPAAGPIGELYTCDLAGAVVAGEL